MTTQQEKSDKTEEPLARHGVEKVMGKMHFYVCLRVEKSNETCLGLTSGLLLWLRLVWQTAAALNLALAVY